MRDCRQFETSNDKRAAMFFLVLVIVVLAILYYHYHCNDARVVSSNKFDALHPVYEQKEFDMIVVGAGAAASAFLHYLQANYPADKSVLLIESGTMGDLPKQSHISGSWYKCLVYPELEHGLKTTKQAGLNGKTLPYHRGKGKGGSALLNAQMWVLGNPKDWDQQGFPEWTFEHVHPHFKAMESYPAGDPKFRGHDGPIPIRDASTKSKVYKSLRNLMGMKHVDYNQHQEGSINFCQQNNTESQQRINPFDALVDVSGLCVLDAATVQRVLFDDRKRATAVEVRLQQGASPRLVTIKARERIVLCAGAIATPHILMQSGVGPRDHLQQVGVPVVADLPVGSELIDHAGLPISCVLKEAVDNVDGSGLDVTGFYTSDWAKKNEPERGPDMQYCCGGGPMLLASAPTTLAWKLTNVLSVARTLSRILRRTLVPLIRAKLDRIIYVAPVLNHPRSRGTVRLASSDPKDDPIIDVGLMTDRADVKRFITAARKTVSLLRGWSLFETFVDKDMADAKTDEDFEKIVKKHTIHGWHVACTAPLGKVVEPSTLQVIGCSGLCVADISIMTNISSGNTMVPAMLCGRRSAELILNSL